MKRGVYSLYQIDIIKHDADTLTVQAQSRRGMFYYAHLKRTKDNYWEGGTDFGYSSKKIFKGIILEFFQELVAESKEYDNRWYSLHYVVRGLGNGETRPLTWEETHYGNMPQEAEPNFKGGVKFYTESYA